MELTRTEVFRAINSMDVTIVRECEGTLLLPVASHTHTYEDQDGKEHSVLVLKDGKTVSLYKTEVQAFIKKYLSYEEAFWNLPDEEKPLMLIKLTVSKKGNKYVTFDIQDQ